MFRCPLSLFLLLFAVPTFAQASQSARQPQPEDFGTVAGHVMCSDTQHPARLAEVRLVPVAVTLPTRPDEAERSGGVGASVPPVETDMSGAFTMRRVVPGQYYLRVDYPGYMTPMLNFSRAQLAKPTLQEQQRIAQDLQVISVAPHATTQADAMIVRGSAISGTVTYDDGSAAINIRVLLLRRNAKGEFKDEFETAHYMPPTDDHGRYRADALPPGDYVVEADLAMSEHTVSSIPMPNGGGEMQLTMTNSLFDLPVYSGSVLRRRDAVLVQTAAGQETPDTDLSIPLSKLHHVSGALLAKDGHSINGGDVELLHSDDRERLARVKVDREDKEFHFPYVPEDDYILSVPAPKDITQVEVENAKGSTPRTHLEDKTVRTYGAAEQPLNVQTDMTGVLVNIPEKTPDKKESTLATPSGSNEFLR